MPELVTLAVWIPFGDLLHHETGPIGETFKATIGKPAWWSERARIMERFTLPSLHAQRPRAHFQTWAHIMDCWDQEKLSAPVRQALDKSKLDVKIIFRSPSSHDARGQSPRPEITTQLLKSCETDWLVWVWLCFDDM